MSGEKEMKGIREYFITPMVKFGDGSLIVWGCFSWNGVGTLINISRIINPNKYISILNENLEKATVKIGLEEDFVFQQDNIPNLFIYLLPSSNIKY